MASDRTDNRTPLQEIPEAGRQVRPATPNKSIQGRLQPAVDRIRQLVTTFGLRSYRVFLVHQTWTGGRRGVGEPMEISRREILPTPRVADMTATLEVMRAFGLQEEGSLTVDKITSKYTEDDLMGRTPDLLDVPNTRAGGDEFDFFWEVVAAREDNPNPVRRRYVPTSAPHLSKGGFGWRVVLTKQEYDRNRSGGSGTAVRRFQ